MQAPIKVDHQPLDFGRGFPGQPAGRRKAA
jgi:hypothetical protein